ncbi:SPRY domain-containing protein [Bradyrhizobium sp. JR3.5]
MTGVNWLVEITAESILQCRVGAITAPPPVVSVSSAFDPGSVSNATLSNADLTATRTNTSTGGARSISYQSSGKFYFEVTVGASHGSTDFVGVMAASYGYFPAVNGNTGSGVGVWLGSGSIVSNGGPSGSLGAGLSAGNIIGVAFDADNARIWFRVNGGNWNGVGTANPATNTGGASYPVAAMAPAVAFSPYGSPVAGDNLTANLGASAFSGSVPFGFTSGWPP